MQAQRRRLLPSFSPFAGLSASGPPEMDFPQFVEDTRDAIFHKDISTGSLLRLAAPFTRRSSICPGECEVGKRFSPRSSCPDHRRTGNHNSLAPLISFRSHHEGTLDREVLAP